MAREKRTIKRNTKKPSMRLSRLHVLIAVIIVVSSLFVIFRNQFDNSLAATCNNTSTGLAPLNDLGVGFYGGYQGGLYPGGSNEMPASHRVLGASVAASIQPLNENGEPDPNGKIIYTSIGMSNTRNKFAGIDSSGDLIAPDAFKFQAESDPEENPNVYIINGAQGSRDINDWLADDPMTWTDLINNKLPAEGGNYLQVQVAWLLHAERIGTGVFPENASVYEEKLKNLVRMAKAKLPNLKIIYISSRGYGGYADNPDRGEPYSHDTAWGVKWAIEDQINGTGNMGLDVAPWIAWGPYIWADGENPRLDGLVWNCSDFSSDGIHPNNQGVKKTADRLLAFSKTEPTACSWFTSTNCGANSPSPTPTPTNSPTPTTSPTPTPTAVACAAPTIIASKDTKPTSGGNISLRWNAVNGASQYKVERQNKNGTWSTRQTTSSTSYSGADASNDPNWRVFASSGSCSPLPGPATVIDP